MKRKFEEAIKFAKQFNLQTEEIYKAKTLMISSKLDPWITGLDVGQIERGISELFECLENVSDLQFIVKHALETTLHTADYSYKLLCNAYNRLENSTSTSNEVSSR